MQSIEWKEEYSVGVRHIDAQHRHILSILNRVQDVLLTESAAADLKTILTEMDAYAAEHFNTEEDILTRFNYYDLDQHKREHRLYQEKIKAYREQMQAGTLTINLEMREFLIDWWTGHILGADRDFRRFLNNHGVF